MKPIILDTNMCIYIQKNKPEHMREKFKQFDVGDLSLSSITISELYHGAYKSKFTEKKSFSARAFFETLYYP